MCRLKAPVFGGAQGTTSRAPGGTSRGLGGNQDGGAEGLGCKGGDRTFGEWFLPLQI